MDRATKAVAAAKLERARIIMDLAKSRIEIIIGESLNSDDGWSDDDI